MAARAAAARIPRLRLFSGPNCSLCDVAKAELAQVRKTLAPARLRARDNQHPGARPGIVEKEVCLLDPSRTSRRQGDREGPMDRANSDRRAGEVAEGGGDPGQQLEERLKNIPSPHLFFEQDTPGEPCYTFAGIYVRLTDDILGEEDEDMDSLATSSHPSRSRCFNCGSPEHVLATCPNDISRQLVALSRQMHDFYRNSAGSSGSGGRLWAIEDWRTQRLNWLAEFQPGEALGPGSHPWLENMMIWGYPPGWYSGEDPRDRVRVLIEGSSEEPAILSYSPSIMMKATLTLRKSSSLLPRRLPRHRRQSDLPHHADGQSTLLAFFIGPSKRHASAPFAPRPPLGPPPPPPPPPPPGSPPPPPPPTSTEFTAATPPLGHLPHLPPSSPNTPPCNSPLPPAAAQQGSLSISDPSQQDLPTDGSSSLAPLRLSHKPSFVPAFSLKPYFVRHGYPACVTSLSLPSSNSEAEESDDGEQDMDFSDAE
ncbi:hypothetical protein BD626DRAFT_555930 [Schizophyllum amplum]|uniref:CCHC-type domain-containing protein n=1 Tax=Schizophyllum amplum TaxID=97359 RepID=A0A550CM39_9AGAR|nr:hypothetical protein BD626DRAFT_555930 [Auriculariopsis ampla]